MSQVRGQVQSSNSCLNLIPHFKAGSVSLFVFRFLFVLLTVSQQSCYYWQTYLALLHSSKDAEKSPPPRSSSRYWNEYANELISASHIDFFFSGMTVLTQNRVAVQFLALPQTDIHAHFAPWLASCAEANHTFSLPQTIVQHWERWQEKMSTFWKYTSVQTHVFQHNLPYTNTFIVTLYVF